VGCLESRADEKARREHKDNEGPIQPSHQATGLDGDGADLGQLPTSSRHVFSSHDDLVGVDLDSCFEEDGTLKPEAQNAINLLDSYTERSPSGKGLHIICRGHLPGSGHCDKKNGREMYQQERFFTITADIVDGKSEVIERKENVRQLYEDWFGASSLRDYKAGDLHWDHDAPIAELDALRIPDYTKNLIRNGENMDDFLDVDGNHDRSLALFYVCRELVSNLVNKETILSILTDPANYLAQAGLDRRGGDIESAQEWVWKYSLAKVVNQWEEERALFDDLTGEDGDAQGDDTEEDDLDSSISDEADGSHKDTPEYVKGNFERNALIFLKHSTPLICHQETFFLYTGKHWQSYSEEQVKRDIHFAVKGRGFTMAQINNMITTVMRFAVKDDFEASPTHIAFDNGVIDLDGWDIGLVDLTLVPHSPKHRTMSYLKFSYDGEAQCPEWLKFLNEVFEGDAERALLLQQMMGYLLVYDYRFQKILNMVGESRSGKGTIASVIRDLVGHDSYAGTSLSSMSTLGGLEPLMKAKVAVIADAKQATRSNINQAHEALLNISGNDFIPVRRLYHKPVTMQVPARLVIMSNNVPRFADESDALYNRYLVLPFTVSFAGREDVGLSERLKTELPGIFNWAVQGLLNLAAAGKFAEPKIGEEAADEIRVHSNPLGTFVERFLVADSEAAVPRRELFESYSQFCRAIGSNPMPQNEFGRKLSKAAPWVKRTRASTGDRAWEYSGIRMDLEALSEVIESEFD
jgi:P4 family phage/plasmid primase-like protien